MLLKSFTILIFILAFSAVKCNNNVEVAEQWSSVLDFAGDFAWPLRTKLINFIQDQLSNGDPNFMSRACNDSLRLYADHLASQTPWATESKYL